MHTIVRGVIRTGASLVLGLAAARSAGAAELAIVDVPQGMILETQLVRSTPAAAPSGTLIDFVVTHDLRVGHYVVIAAGSHGVAHLQAARGRHVPTTARIGFDYVVASDGTRIPVTGSLPFLTTRASRSVVIYGVADAGLQVPAAPVATGSDAPLNPAVSESQRNPKLFR